ncbi:hypothetical protein ABIA32_004529, partial [Streptacidiphilus sp. MAP12-20]
MAEDLSGVDVVDLAGRLGDGVSRAGPAGLSTLVVAEAVGVGAVDGVVGSVGVATELVGVGCFEKRVGLEEAAGGGVEVAGPEEAVAGGGVGGLVEVAAAVDPGGLSGMWWVRPLEGVSDGRGQASPDGVGFAGS